MENKAVWTVLLIIFLLIIIGGIVRNSHAAPARCPKGSEESYASVGGHYEFEGCIL